jgi:putative salt-induced outer membrane protein
MTVTASAYELPGFRPEAPSLAQASEGSAADREGAAAASGKEITASPPSRSWDGEAEAGVVATNGNTRSDNLRARVKLQYLRGRWQHGLASDYLRFAEGGMTTAEQFNAAVKSDRALTARSYAFIGALYSTDRFAGYSPRISASTGYGRRFPFSASVQIEAEAGAGGRHTVFTDGARENEAILRLAAKLRWQLSMTSEFTEDAFSEIGSRNTHSESQTSLKARINAAFALKLNVTVKHDTVVPQDRYKTDTITSVTLVYDL